MSSSEKPNKWIPLIKRPMTKEECEEYKGMTGVTETMILNCPLPEDGEEVLVSYGDYVCIDTFHDDDGCYFEDVEIDEVEAWMPLPAPFKPQERDDNVKINCNKTKCENCINHNYCDDDESCDEILERIYTERDGKK